MKIKTYQILVDQKNLVYEELYDKSGNLIHYIDYISKPQTEKKYEYNEKGLMIQEIEIVNNTVLNTITFDYDNQGRIINQKLFFQNDLYEEITTTYNDDGYIRIIYQEGKEVEKIEKTEIGKNSNIKFFDEEILIELQICNHDTTNNISTTEIYDNNEHLLAIRKQQFDNRDNIIKFQEFNENGNLMSESIYEFEDNLITKETYRDYIGRSEEFIFINKYDSSKNIILSETRTLSNDLLDFHHRKYDSRNKLIAESGYSRGNFNAIYGTYLSNEEFHFEHEYID